MERLTKTKKIKRKESMDTCIEKNTHAGKKLSKEE